MSEIKKRPVGRPAVNATPVTVRIPPDLLESVDAAADHEADKPSRPEMLRRIVKDWLIGHGYLKAGEESDGNGQ